MCKNCQRDILALNATAILAQEVNEQNGPDPLQLAALFMGAAAVGDVEALATMSATLPLDALAKAVHAMAMLAQGAAQLAEDMAGAMAIRVIEHGEEPPEGFEIIKLDGLEAQKAAASMPVPPDDNPELLKAIFQNRPKKGKGGKGGPVS